MSLSRGEWLVSAFERQDPFDAERPWLTRVASWRVSAQTYHQLSALALAMEDKMVTPLITWSLIRDPKMLEGHAVPLDAHGNEVTPWGSPT